MELFLEFDPERGILAGERWEQAFNAAAARCKAVVFLISRAWIASSSRGKKISVAQPLNKSVLAVLIEDIPVDDMPKDLSGEQQLARLASGRQATLGTWNKSLRPTIYDRNSPAEGLTFTETTIADFDASATLIVTSSRRAAGG